MKLLYIKKKCELVNTNNSISINPILMIINMQIFQYLMNSFTYIIKGGFIYSKCQNYAMKYVYKKNNIIKTIYNFRNIK